MARADGFQVLMCPFDTPALPTLPTGLVPNLGRVVLWSIARPPDTSRHPESPSPINDISLSMPFQWELDFQVAVVARCDSAEG